MIAPTFNKPNKQAELLQSCVVATIDVALTLKQLHWNIHGPKFQPIHEFLDVVIEHARGATDQMAERMVTMGVPAIGQRSTLPSPSAPSVPNAFTPDDKVIELACDTLVGALEVLRKAQEETGEIDAVTEDLIIGLIAPFEQQLWMLRSHLL